MDLIKKVLAIEIENPIGIDAPSGQAGLNIILGRVVNIVAAVAGLIFLAMLLVAGFRWLTAGGDQKALSSARGMLFSAFIGMILVVASFIIAQIIFKVFGLGGVQIGE